MTDIFDQAKRSKMMSAVGSANTKPEMVVRRGLHRLGFRYRLHDRSLPGRPDLVLPKYRAVLFINGCFWHGHECEIFKWPSTRSEFWREKILANRARDRSNTFAAMEQGWRVLVIGECALKGPARIGVDATIEETARWLSGSLAYGEIYGRTIGD